MAANNPKKAKPSTLAAIDSSAIIKSLLKHGLTHPGRRYYKAEYKQPSQVTALVALLKKTIPDLAAHTLEVTDPILVEVLQVASHKTTK